MQRERERESGLQRLRCAGEREEGGNGKWQRVRGPCELEGRYMMGTAQYGRGEGERPREYRWEERGIERHIQEERERTRQQAQSKKKQ